MENYGIGSKITEIKNSLERLTCRFDLEEEADV